MGNKGSMKSYILWDKKQCHPLKVNRRLGGTCRFHIQGSKGRKVSSASYKLIADLLLAYSTVLKMEATYPSETYVDFQRTT
jgi:hypothetical protein